MKYSVTILINIFKYMFYFEKIIVLLTLFQVWRYLLLQRYFVCICEPLKVITKKLLQNVSKNVQKCCKNCIRTIETFYFFFRPFMCSVFVCFVYRYTVVPWAVLVHLLCSANVYICFTLIKLRLNFLGK